MNGLLEILTTKKWMVSPDFAHGIRKTLEHNLNGHIAVGFDGKKLPYAVQRKAKGETPEIKSYQVTEKGKQTSRWYMEDMDEPFINVMPVQGPITRSGGACSYGSVDLRDWLIEAANNEYCVAQVFYIDSPGGSAWAKNDFQQGIDYSHKMGKRVYAFIDGTCASAAMWLASLCDEVYYMHPKDQIGCIGVLAAFYSEKDGDKNQFTDETYHELYDPQSFDKNKWYRDIVNKGDDTELINELKADGKEFRAQIHKSFPKAKKEHLHGKTFNAEDVDGILCDGQMTFGDLLRHIFEVSDGTVQPLVREVPSYPENPEDPDDDDDTNAASKTNNNSQNKINMEKYQKIATACGVSEFVCNEEGTHFVPAMLDKLNETLEKQAAEKADADKKIAELTAQLTKANEENAALKTANEKALADAKEANDKALADAKEANDKALADAKDANDKAMADAKADADKKIADAEKKASDAEQNVKDLQNKVAELTAQAASAPQQSPATNGANAEQKERVCGMPEYDEFKTPLENKKIRDEYFANLRKQL